MESTKVSTEVTDPAQIALAQELVKAHQEDGNYTFSDVGRVTRLFKHTVVPSAWFALTDGDWAYVILGGLEPGNIVIDAPDIFDFGDPAFHSATVREDGTWVYSPDPDPTIGEDETPVWHCYEYYDAAAGTYGPSKFAPGSVVYPLIFCPNTSGGWQVYSADGKVREYWQCE